MKASSNALRWILLAVIAISFAINYAGIFDPKMDTNGDNYQYYQLAHSLARGDGYVTDFEPVQTRTCISLRATRPSWPCSSRSSPTTSSP